MTARHVRQQHCEVSVLVNRSNLRVSPDPKASTELRSYSTVSVWPAFAVSQHQSPHTDTQKVRTLLIRGALAPTAHHITAIPRLTKIIRSGITFVSRNLR